MFTGIIEEIGKVKEVVNREGSMRLRIECHKVLNDVQIGDSIAVNGICLTVTTFTLTEMEADVMPETLRNTSLFEAKPGKQVNLERALPVNGRLGGHIVTGHIDGTGKIIRKYREGNALWLIIDTHSEMMKYIVHKGSIAIDGTSLTVAKTDEGSFAVSLIPHTAEMTILADKETGSMVNLECDVLGKYIEKLMQPQEKKHSSITMETLKKYGF